MLAVLIAVASVSCVHGDRSRELSVDALRTLTLRHMNENAARWVPADHSGRPPFEAEHLRAIEDYAALGRGARAWYSGRMADDFLKKLTGGDTSGNRVHFIYTKTLRNWLYASIQRDGADIRTAVMTWCR